MNPENFKSLITLALDTSPLTRMYHDQYYPQKLFTYGYADLVDHAGEMRFDAAANKQKLYVGTECSDQFVPTVINHEITHVSQQIIANRYEYDFDIRCLSKEDYISYVLVAEAQAFANEIEGPAVGFLNDYKKGKSANNDFYKGHVSNRHGEGQDVQAKTKKFLENYVDVTFLTDDVDTILNMSAEINMNNQTHRSSETLAELQANARVNLIKSFLDPKNDGDSPQLEHYVDRNLEIYSQVPNFTQKDLPLKKLLETTKVGEKDYLSLEKWHEALSVTSCKELAEKTIFSVGQKRKL